MKLGRLAWLLPALFVAGCPLSSFDKVGPGQGSNGGSAGAGGDASMAAAAGAAGEDPGDGGLLEAIDDEYVVRQGETINRAAAAGVLQNDSGAGLFVSAQSDDNPGLSAEFEATYNIMPNGELSFTPAPDFFGVYRVSYTITDSAAREATATVSFVVQPRDIDLGTVAKGAGGLAVTTPVAEGLGTSLASAGDLNNDGKDDLIIGASTAAGGSGRIYVIYGTDTLDALDVGPSPVASEPRYFTMEGAAADAAGNSVSGAGNLNGDQFDDMIIGANHGGTAAGRAYVVYGGAIRGAVALDALAADRGYAINGGNDPDFNTGKIVGGGGDYNGDGTPDLLLGTSGPPTNQGRLNVLFGDPGEGMAAIDLATHAPKLAMDGLQSNNDRLPEALAFAGDVNGDGNDDIFTASVRRVALIWGRSDLAFPATVNDVDAAGANWGLELTRASPTGVAAVSAAGNVNGDELADIAFCDLASAGGPPECLVGFGEPANLTSGWRFRGFAAARIPLMPVRCADMTQDDLSDPMFAESQAAYVIFGKSSGHDEVVLDMLGDSGFRVAAEAGGAITAVSSAGDFNGDGYGDYAFADSGANGGNGKVYVLFGGDYAPR